MNDLDQIKLAFCIIFGGFFLVIVLGTWLMFKIEDDEDNDYY